MDNNSYIPNLNLKYIDGEILFAKPLNTTTKKINDIIDEINKRKDPWENF